MNKLKRTTVFFAVCLLVAGCNGVAETKISYKFKAACKAETANKRADFILECVNNANPKSDEEPEGWIRQCQWMAEDTFCEKKKIKVTMFKPAGGYLEVMDEEVIDN